MMADATCPYCRTPFVEDDDVVPCTACATKHHADCLEENGGCTVFGCSQAPAEEPKISVSNQDLRPASREEARPPAPPSSFLNLSAAEPPSSPAQRVATPPPPRPAGATPPAGVSQPAVMTYPTFAGYAPPPPSPDRYTPRKSRVVFVLLAVFLGGFGGHNFYAGYIKKAVIQLCITVFSCFIGSFVSWIWAIVEACVVDRDDDGVAFV